MDAAGSRNKVRRRTLTEEMVFMRTKCNRMDLIQNLNLWGNDLHNIRVLRDMPNLEVLSLSVNSVSSLADLRHLSKLSELYLRKNNIRDLGEVLHLTNLHRLEVLWLNDNPCARLPHYRQYVIHHLPKLRKLDSQDVTEDERRSARQADMSGVVTCGDGEPDREADGDVSELQGDVSMSSDIPGGRGPRRGGGPDPGGFPASRDGFGGMSSAAGSRRYSTEASHHGGRVLETADEDPMAMLYEGRRQSRHQDFRDPPPQYAPPDYHQQEVLGRSTQSGHVYGQQYEADIPEQLTPRSEAQQGRHQAFAAWPHESPARGRHGCGGDPPGMDDRGPGPLQRYSSMDGGLGDAYGRRDWDRDRDRDEQPLPRGSPTTAGFGGSAMGGGGFGMGRDREFASSGGGAFVGSGGTDRSARADNILCAVLALIKELDRQGLELVRRAIEQRQSEL